MPRAATILHADLDAFYASVEQYLDPSLRGKAIAVGGGVVLAASYEAKAYGVRGGMSGRMARKLCPELVFVRGTFSRYKQMGDAAIAILQDFTPAVERISIDEAFGDVAGSEHLFGSPAKIAARIRHRVRSEVGLPISVGVACTKHLAKIASQVAKPDGLVVVEPGEETEFLRDLPVDLVWGVGPVTRAKLAAREIRTIGQLASLRGHSLVQIVGAGAGRKLESMAKNRDPRRVARRVRARSVGAQSALGKAEACDSVIDCTLLHLADRIATRLRKKGRSGWCVTARVRFADLRSVTRSVTLAQPVCDTRTLAEIAGQLVRRALDDHPEESVLSLLAISVSSLAGQRPDQLGLPFAIRDGMPSKSFRTDDLRHAADRALDAIREKFGPDAVNYGSLLLRKGNAVPDAFRALAQKDL